MTSTTSNKSSRRLHAFALAPNRIYISVNPIGYMLLPNRPHRIAAQIAQVMRAVISLACLAVLAQQYYMLHQATLGNFPAPGEGVASDQRIEIMAVLQIVVGLPAAVALIIWMYRAYENAHRIPEARPRHASSMAAWGWFIPIINLWYPCRIMQEIGHYTGRFSHSQENTISSRWDYAVAGWWVLNILSVVISRVAAMMDSSLNDTLANLLVYDRFLLFGHLASLGSAVMTFILLRMVAPHEQA